MKILVFDNYDSFTYNIVHLVSKITNKKVDVFRNDDIVLEKINEYDKIILSPGPGIPSEAGLLMPLIKMFASSKSILGVCLGHQAIAQAFGGTLINLDVVYHGVATPVTLLKNTSAIWNELPENIEVGRYHSWIVSDDNFPNELLVTARDYNTHIMGLKHKTFDVEGIQFHPESIMTPDGEKILINWLKK